MNINDINNLEYAQLCTLCHSTGDTRRLAREEYDRRTDAEIFLKHQYQAREATDTEESELAYPELIEYIRDQWKVPRATETLALF